jgi:transcriptional regulator GlxA family with amidase domain
VHKRQSFQEIIDRFERAARANLDKLSHIPDLCQAADVSQRTLSRACRAIRGTTPARHLQAIRLDAARAALLSANAKVESITQVAMQFGFRELGRFALQYRAKFGENPSATLRRSVAEGRHRASGVRPRAGQRATDST